MDFGMELLYILCYNNNIVNVQEHTPTPKACIKIVQCSISIVERTLGGISS